MLINAFTIDGVRYGYTFWCPGCEHHHAFYTESYRGKPTWYFNGDTDNPTFSPSLLNTYPDGRRCHLFVRGGQIQFCSDSYHSLAGKTVPLEDHS